MTATTTTAGAVVRDDRRRARAIGPFSVGAVGCAVACAVVHLATLGYGLHRDEYYYLAVSRNFQGGYVELQPGLLFLVRLERVLFGDSQVGLRLIPTAGAVATVLLGALIARELGGSRRAQGLAAFAMLVTPLLLGLSSTVTSSSIEIPAWMLVAWLVARLLRTRDPRLWPAIGAAIGCCLLVKFTGLAYAAALGIGVLVTDVRTDLRTKWPWIGALVTAAMLTPSLLWQRANGWPILEFVGNQRGQILGITGRPGFVLAIVVLPGPVAAVLWACGGVHLLRSATFRTLGFAELGALAILFVGEGRSYYAAPALAVLMSAGSVAVAARSRRAARTIGALMLASAIVAAPITLPILPVSVLRDHPALAHVTQFDERFGAEDLVRSVSDVFASLPEDERDRAIVLTTHYGGWAAIDYYRDDYPLPPAGSGHNAASLYPPPARADRVTIYVGFRGFDAAVLDQFYADVTPVATIHNAEGIENQESGSTIYVARGPRLVWSEEWSQLRHLGQLAGQSELADVT